MALREALDVGWVELGMMMDWLALVVEVDVEDGGAAAIPDVLGDGEAKEDHAFGGFAGVDHGLAKERGGGEGFDLGEGGVDGCRGPAARWRWMVISSPSAVVRVAVKSLRKRGRWRRSSMRRVVRT